MENFIPRSLLTALINPTPWIGILLLSGLILLWVKRIRPAKVILTVAIGLFFLIGFDPLPEVLLHNTETKFEGFTEKTIKAEDKIKYIVVLAGGIAPTTLPQPITSILSEPSLIRAVEGIRIQRLIKNSILVFTGKGTSKTPESSGMKELAIGIGVAPDRVITEEKSMNTYEHTVYLKDMLKGEKFVLVTSALHMPRAMRLFEKAGMNPIPAPTGHILKGNYQYMQISTPFPQGDNFHAMDLWFTELASTVRAFLKGWI